MSHFVLDTKEPKASHENNEQIIEEKDKGFFNETLNRKRRCRKIIICSSIVLVLGVFFAFWHLIPLFMCPNTFHDLNRRIYSDDKFTNTSINIALVGDSLTDNACTNYNLVQRLHHLFPTPLYPEIKFRCIGHLGFRLNKILSKIIYPLLNDAILPDGIILHSDADATELYEEIMLPSQIDQTHAEFQDYLRTIITVVKRHNISMIGISGPDILGENTFGMPEKWWHKRKYLVDYYRMTKSIASQNDILYIDIRQAFLEKLSGSSMSHPLYCGYLTFDGEHFNADGVDINAELYADAIRKWLLFGYKKK